MSDQALQALQVLIIEDLESDAALVVRILRKSGYQVSARRVETAVELGAALDAQAWDVVISDYNLPQLNAPGALALIQQRGLDIPFIVVSGTIGEETAVELLKAGAHDYLVKDRLIRLPPAVEREIREARARHERRREQQALAESEARFSTIFQASPEVIAIYRLENSRFIDVNQAWEKLTGFTRQEAIGHTTVELGILIDPLDQQRLLDKIISQGRVWDFECQIRRRSGEIVDLSLSAEPIELAGVPCLVSMAQDITRRKQVENLLQVRMRLMEYAVSSSLEELLVKTLDEVCELTGSPVGFYHFVDPDQQTLTLQAWSTRTAQEFCTAAGKGLHYSVSQAGVWADPVHLRRPVIHNDYAALPHKKGIPEGHAMLQRELVVPIFRNEQIVAILGVGNKAQDYVERDVEVVTYLADIAWEIAERKKAEAALRENEAHYRAVTETAHDAIITTDAQGLIVAWNQGASRLFGYDAAEAIGLPLARLLPDPGRPPLDGSGVIRTVEGEAELTGMPVERRGLRKDGRAFLLEMSQASWETQKGQFFTSILRDISDRKRTEEFLYLQSAALEAAANAILLTDRQGIIQWANRAFFSLSGYSMEEAVGKNLRGLVKSGAHQPVFYKQLWETILAGQIWQGEIINRRKDSSLYVEQMSITPIVDINGVVTHFIAIKQEITQQKRSEQALLEEKERYRSLYENVPVGLYRTTPAGQILMANPALVHMLGYATLDELSHRDLVKGFVRPSSRREFQERMEQDDLVQGFVSRYLRKDGSQIYVRESGRVVRDLAGRVLYYEGTLEDITQIRLSEQQNLRLAAVIEQAAEMVILCDADGQILYVNPAFEKMSGAAAADMVGRNISFFSRFCQDVQEWESLMNISRSGSSWRGSIQFRKPVGAVVELEVTISPVKGLEEGVSSQVFLLRDITQERLAEIQHRQSQKLEAIGQLAAGIAHEINTPTQFIGNNIRFIQNGFQELLPLLELYQSILRRSRAEEIFEHDLEEVRALEQSIDTGFLAAEIPAALEGSLKGIDRVSRIVNAMKEFSHPGGHEKSLTDINHAIENTVIVSRNEWKYVAELTTDLDPDLPLVPCLVDEFNQVMLNLITNAADAIRESQAAQEDSVSGQIEISTRRSGPWAVVRVSDNGAGIPERIRHRVFEPFFTTKEVGKGSGQGLPISYDLIVNKHGGKIDFETQEGMGTTFIIHLPVE